jgi:glutathione-specific gamma-glutamylcyclotransferase
MAARHAPGLPDSDAAPNNEKRQQGGAMANPWVFGYGSLIWNPGFAYLSAAKAVLHGAHRSLSVYSFRHRGTRELPGLVFGLSHGGSCLGVAFEVAEANWPEVFAYLQEREQDRGVYREKWRKVRLADGRGVSALAYFVDEAHEQFAGGLKMAEQVSLIRRSRGVSGQNTEYVLNTAARLLELGIRDRGLMAIVAALDEDAGLAVASA